MANALKKIAARAKEIRKRHPNKHRKWSGFIQEASAEYRKHTPAFSSSKRKKTSMRKKTNSRRTTAKRRPTRKKVRRSVSMAGGLTVSQHLTGARNLIAEKIAHLELRKFTSQTRREKRKISRDISALKREYRKLKT